MTFQAFFMSYSLEFYPKRLTELLVLLIYLFFVMCRITFLDLKKKRRRRTNPCWRPLSTPTFFKQYKSRKMWYHINYRKSLAILPTSCTNRWNKFRFVYHLSHLCNNSALHLKLTDAAPDVNQRGKSFINMRTLYCLPWRRPQQQRSSRYREVFFFLIRGSRRRP